MAAIKNFINGDEFDECRALAYLLLTRVLFVNNRPYVENPYDPIENQVIAKPTMMVFVNSSKVFGWNIADGESVSCSTDADMDNELYRLTRYMTEDEMWGAVRYVCWKRNRQPMDDVIKAMKEDNSWDDFMESLPKS